MKNFIFLLLLLTSLCIHCQTPSRTSGKSSPLPDCEWCGASEAPKNISWETQIAPESEAGEPLHLYGYVFEADGKTPASNILIYAYHTNHQGIYPKKGDETGNGRRHGYLRSWMRTDEQGRYALHSIKPAPYPNRPEPAHVHLTLKGEAFEEYWIASTLFEGDTLIGEKVLVENKGKGSFSAVVKLTQNEQGIWEGRRDILLKK